MTTNVRFTLTVAAAAVMTLTIAGAMTAKDWATTPTVSDRTGGRAAVPTSQEPTVEPHTSAALPQIGVQAQQPGPADGAVQDSAPAPAAATGQPAVAVAQPPVAQPPQPAVAQPPAARSTRDQQGSDEQGDHGHGPGHGRGGKDGEGRSEHKHGGGG
jgi:hypothetical protein